MTVHNHGTEEGRGLNCGELRLPDGSLKGECLINPAVQFNASMKAYLKEKNDG